MIQSLSPRIESEKPDSQSEVVVPVCVIAVGEGHLPSRPGGERPPAEVLSGQRCVVLRRPGGRRAVPRPRPHSRRVPVVDVQAQRLRRGRRHGGHEQRPKQRRHSRPRHGKGKQSKDKTAAFAARNMERSARLPAAIYPGFVREPGKGRRRTGRKLVFNVCVPAASARQGLKIGC
jgi:hypothetical protein